MKIDQLKKKSEKDLEKTLWKKRAKLRVLRFGLASGKVKNVKEVRGVKKDIARILTLLVKTREVKHKT